jgi:hypothetical protein
MEIYPWKAIDNVRSMRRLPSVKKAKFESENGKCISLQLVKFKKIVYICRNLNRMLKTI